MSGEWFPRPVPSNVDVGHRTKLYSSYAFLHYRSERGVRVGSDTGIYWGTFFDVGPQGRVEIGDHCTIVSPVISTNARVVIGDYAFVSFEVVIADRECAQPTRAGDPGPGRDVVLEQDAWIGMRAVVLGGARIGRGAIVGAGSVVDFEVPPYVVVAGNPARVVGSSDPRATGAPS